MVAMMVPTLLYYPERVTFSSITCSFKGLLETTRPLTHLAGKVLFVQKSIIEVLLELLDTKHEAHYVSTVCHPLAYFCPTKEYLSHPRNNSKIHVPWVLDILEAIFPFL